MQRNASPEYRSSVHCELSDYNLLSHPSSLVKFGGRPLSHQESGRRQVLEDDALKLDIEQVLVDGILLPSDETLPLISYRNPACTYRGMPSPVSSSPSCRLSSGPSDAFQSWPELSARGLL